MNSPTSALGGADNAVAPDPPGGRVESAAGTVPDPGVNGDDNDQATSSGEVSDDGSDSETKPSCRQLCWRLPLVGGRGRWVIAGPITDQHKVNPIHFCTAIVVEGLPTLSCREVYVRSVPILVKKGIYSCTAAAYASVRHVSAEHGKTSGSSEEEPSWYTGDAVALPIRRVLDRAADAVKRAGGRVDQGFIKFISFVPLPSHPWYAHMLRLQRRRHRRRGAVAYMRALSRMTNDDERRLLGAANCSSLIAVRHATTYNVRTPAEKAGGLRALKKRPWWGIGAPNVIPARKRLIGMKRRVFERSARVGHAMVTLRDDGAAEVWTYVRGSGLLGVRLYKATDGTVKRLACHSHKQRKHNPAGHRFHPGASAVDCHGAAGTVDNDGDTVDGNNGKESGAAAAAARACPVPEAERVADAGPSGPDAVTGSRDEFPGDSPLSDWGGAQPAGSGQRGLTSEELWILRCSTLENMDGSDPLVIVAVEFDVVAAVSAAIARRTVKCTAQDVVQGRPAWSMGSDGGPIRNAAVTVFSLCLSASWLYNGRTPMLPVMYILAGEHYVHSALGDRLDAILTAAVQATYEIPVQLPSDSDAVGTDGDAAATDGLHGRQPVYNWRGPQLVRIVGDFSMLSHIMGLTGGSGDSRCPYWWPCASDGFLSIISHAEKHGRRRTVKDVTRQWELVCWQLARWSVLRSTFTSLDEGMVSVRCLECGARTPLSSPSPADFRCSTAVCPGLPCAFHPIPQTPLKAMFNLLRRRAGGVRSYPVLRTVPILLQVPVLHCTGSIVKKITYLFLAELGEATRTVAKRGIYDVTGRVNLGDLYLREHIKLAALLVACEDIVKLSVDPVVMTMWSLALLLTAGWRQALAGPMQHRQRYVEVVELAAGLLAPLWSAVKPLDKEKNGAGVASLYLHAALVHARDSLGDNSPAEAVITDDHVEGTIRDMGRHCATRVNNVARAQAVTEFHAIADDDAATVQRNRFAAELHVYTDCIQVCSCCSAAIGRDEAADLVAAVQRAREGNVIDVSDADEEEGTALSLRLPSDIVFRPDDGAAAHDAWESKEAKIARVLSDRLRVLPVCICGTTWDRPVGSFGMRLSASHAQDGGEIRRTVQDVTAPSARDERRDLQGAPATPVRDRGPSVRHGDARLWMRRHAGTCQAHGAACDGGCLGDAGGAAVEAAAGGLNDGAEDSSDDDGHEGDALPDPHHRDGTGDDVAPPDGWDDDRNDVHDLLDHAPTYEPGGARAEGGHCAGTVAGGRSAGARPWPLLSSDVLSDPHLSPWAPPRELLEALLGDTDYRFEGSVAAADACRRRIAEEDMLLRVFLVRMRDQEFLRWAKTQSVHWGGMYDAVQNVITRLHVVRGSLPGACLSTL